MLLIHLSDIHFRLGEVGTAMDPNFHLRNELLIDAKQMCERLGVVPAAVMISGDIAFSGDKKEYEFALTWLEKFCSNVGTTTASVFVVPGNHDVVRSVASRDVIQMLHRDIKSASDVYLNGRLRSALYDPDSARLLYESIEPYNFFAGQFFCALLPPENTIARRDLPLNDGSTLRLSGLNSTFVSSTADKPNDLFVDPAAFQITRERGVEHVVLCHHPYFWLRKGEDLQDHLKDVARIHLFGHDHANRIETARDYVKISASAAHPDRAEHGWEPGYNLIEVEVVGADTQRRLDVRVHVRVWQSRPGQFIAKMDRADDLFHQEIQLDSWTKPNSALKPISEDEIVKSIRHELNITESMPEPARSDPMSNTLREVSVRFFKLTLSQKTAIAGKLGLFEDEDVNHPDFERYRRVFIRARDRGLVEQLDIEIAAISTNQNNLSTQ